MLNNKSSHPREKTIHNTSHGVCRGHFDSSLCAVYCSAAYNSDLGTPTFATLSSVTTSLISKVSL